jgi:predicted MFS family arabinose efflux permease
MTAVLLNLHSWRMPFIVFGVTGIVFVLLIQFGIKSWFSEIDADKENESKAFHGHNELHYDGSTIWNPVTILLSLATICAGVTAFGFFGLFPLYLRNGLGFSPTQAAAVLGLIGIGGFTAPIGGWIGDRIGYYKVLFVTVPVMGLSAGVSYTALGGSVLWHAFFALVQGIAVIGVLYANLSAVIIKSMNRDKSGTASGMFVSSYYIPAAFAGYLVGWLKDISDWTTAGMTVSFGFAAISVILLFIAYTIQESASTRGRTPSKVNVPEA